ncbi:MAG: type II secretion system protein [Synergistaceae bacterium]|nr:type II secretion system protein [Synergistaceae bacterium]
MKRTRKGLTLIELVVVMSIVAILATTLTMPMVGSTGKAKATAIVSNLDIIKAQTALYYAKYFNDNSKVGVGGSDAQGSTALKAAYTKWDEYFKDNDVIKYTPDGDGAANWYVLVNFSGDPESSDIAEVLGSMKGYTEAYVDGRSLKDKGAETGGRFKFFPLTGEISADKVGG